MSDSFRTAAMTEQTSPDHGAVEITSFRIKCILPDFIEANQDIDEWIQKQPGFRARQMYQLNNIVTDMVFWDSEAEGVASMHRLMQEHADSVVHDLIDQGSVSWNVVPLRHSISRA
jgi:hypothetical protein